jgi:hypothetical protein
MKIYGNKSTEFVHDNMSYWLLFVRLAAEEAHLDRTSYKYLMYKYENSTKGQKVLILGALSIFLFS